MNSLRIENISFRYSHSHPFIFENVSLKILFGCNIVFVGDNGSGKTTLGKLISGLLKPTNGTILVSNDEPWKLQPRTRIKRAFYIVQDNHLQFFRTSIRDEILFTRRIVNSTIDYGEAYTQFTLPQDLSIHPMDLSVNEMWRFALFLAWIINPTVLFIDEIPAWSNRNNRNSLEILLKQRKNNDLLTFFSFQRELDFQFDRVFKINKGRVENV